jgi:hypothetical protein
MRFIQFFQWYWDQNDWFTRTISVIGVWAIPCFISTIFIGKLGVTLAFGGAVSVAVAWGIYGVFYWLRGMWREFEDARPTPDVAIVRKLKGIPTPSVVKVEDRYYND